MLSTPLQNLNNFLSSGNLITDALAQWNIYTTVLVVLLTILSIHTIATARDPDIHPILLIRQSLPFRIRHKGRSAVYRSLDVPHGSPLRQGLDVKLPSAAKWTPGRDGDLWDIWARATHQLEGGQVRIDGQEVRAKSCVAQILGKEDVQVHSFETLATWTVLLGRDLKAQSADGRVGICLGNTVEWLVALFACITYGLTPVLIPVEYGTDSASLAVWLKTAQVDTLIIAAGAVSLTDVVRRYPGLRRVIWLATKASQHVDWHEIPQGTGSSVAVAVWHDILEDTDSSDTTTKLSFPERPTTKVDLLMIEKDRLVRYTQNNLVAAVGAQIAVLPRSYQATKQHHLTSLDNILPLAPLTEVFPLTIVLAGLYTNSSIALTTVTGRQANYAHAFQATQPTIVIAQADTMASVHSKAHTRINQNLLATWTHRRLLNTLSAGTMPFAPSSLSAKAPRLIYIYDDLAGTASLTTQQLADLRVFTGARTILAFTSSGVAGAVCQTNLLDYAGRGRAGLETAHLGPPLSCVEIWLKKKEGETDIDGEKPVGRVVVAGPAVVGGKLELDSVLGITVANTFYPA